MSWATSSSEAASSWWGSRYPASARFFTARLALLQETDWVRMAPTATSKGVSAGHQPRGPKCASMRPKRCSNHWVVSLPFLDATSGPRPALRAVSMAGPSPHRPLADRVVLDPGAHPVRRGKPQLHARQNRLEAAGIWFEPVTPLLEQERRDHQGGSPVGARKGLALHQRLEQGSHLAKIGGIAGNALPRGERPG